MLSAAVTESAVEEVRDLGADHAGAQDHRPEQGRMKPLDVDLGDHDDQKEHEKDQRGDDVADFEGDAQQVSGGFPQGHGNDLQNPEQHRDMRKLPHHIAQVRPRRFNHCWR